MIRVLIIALFTISCFQCPAQEKDSTLRDLGIGIGWRSLAINYPRSSSAADIVRNLTFTIECRVWNFWLQTGTIVGWNRLKPISEEYNFDLWLAAPYEFKFAKDRLTLGFGPIVSFYHFYSSSPDWLPAGETSISNSISIGADLEFAFNVWEGLQIKTCSDIGVQFVNPGGNTTITPRIIRLINIGIRYRIKAYPR
jgi:hypothetical protein